jgi:predicted alpha/beta hydrolase family esterase
MATSVIIVPGNGCTPVRACNWYGWLHKKLQEAGHKAVLRDMPDPYEAKEKIWLPFMREMGADENAVIVGHSSGAEAAMRLIETDRVRGVCLVAACHTDLGIASETVSGYYSRPWQWERMRANAGWVSQFLDERDCFIPAEEGRHVAESLGTELIVASRGDHFMVPEFPELLDHLLGKLAA